MKQHHGNFRSLKDSTYDEPPRRARGGPVLVIDAGGHNDERAKPKRTKRRCTHPVAIIGVEPRHRLDRPRRRKFADGGAADDDAVVSGDISRRPAQSDDDDSMTTKPNDDAKVVPEDIRGDDRLPSALDRFFNEFQGTKPAYRAGGRAKKFADGGAAEDDDQSTNADNNANSTSQPPTSPKSNQFLRGTRLGYTAGAADAIGRFMDAGDKFFGQFTGTRPAYREGGRTRRPQRRK